MRNNQPVTGREYPFPKGETVISYADLKGQITRANRINGQTGWRLPTKEELSSLYNSGAMNSQGWTLSFTWSGTPFTLVGFNYSVNLAYGNVSPDSVNARDYVTCVR